MLACEQALKLLQAKRTARTCAVASCEAAREGIKGQPCGSRVTSRNSPKWSACLQAGSF